ncbi:hypothetical protein SBA4_860020 [Candidatus Sulfopaludibacter sp. SbA4]|nr:hypothetical protein SBA4_860020 [Candidatus Sulfopaludibacter sp. SbA4]
MRPGDRSCCKRHKQRKQCSPGCYMCCVNAHASGLYILSLVYVVYGNKSQHDVHGWDASVVSPMPDKLSAGGRDGKEGPPVTRGKE